MDLERFKINTNDEKISVILEKLNRALIPFYEKKFDKGDFLNIRIIIKAYNNYLDHEKIISKEEFLAKYGLSFKEVWELLERLENLRVLVDHPSFKEPFTGKITGAIAAMDLRLKTIFVINLKSMPGGENE